jgi:hypothetical protein
MSSFLPGSSDGQIPYPPVDIPAPDTPAPDFNTIGQTFAAAAKAARKESAKDDSMWDWLWRQLVKAVKGVLSSIVDLFTLVIGGILDVLDGTHGSMDRLATVVISSMFGAETKVGSWDNLKDAGSRQQTATNIAQVFLKALSTGQNSSAGLQPSSAGSDAFMKACAHMAIEGWLLGFVVEAAGAGQLETFTELKDIVESSLGLGRLARRAMAAPMKVLVEDPYTWLLNQTWLPTLLTPAELVRAYLNGTFTIEQLNREMGYHGYAPYKVTELINLYKLHLSAADLDVLIDNKSTTQEDAIKRLKSQGYDDADAAALLSVAHNSKVQANGRAWANELTAMFLNHEINIAALTDQMKFTGLPEWETTELIRRAQYKLQVKRTYFTLGEAELLFKKHLIDVNQFHDLAQMHGYSEADIINLELLMLVEIKDADDATARRAAAQSARDAANKAKAKAAADKAALAKLQIEEKGVSDAQYQTLVEQGLRTLQDYYGYMVSKGIASDNALSLLTVLQHKIDAKNAAAATKAAAAGKAKAKNLDVAQLEAAVKQGLLTIADFTTRMEQIGMSSADAELLALELQGQIDSAATKEKAAAAAKAQAAVKHVDLTQEERAVRLGIQTIAQYAAFLDSHGFEPHDRDVLVAELQAQLNTDQQTAATKAAAAAKVSQKGIPLPQLERLVRAGVKTIDDYTAALASAGYNAADQAAMTQYLQLQMQQDQQDLILHGHAAALVGQLGVSLADLERAVKLSVVPIATYQDALKRAGVSSADQTTLVKNLAAQIKATRAAQTTMQSISEQVAAAGVSLAALEKDTVSGKISIEQFQALLAGYGVADADITNVVQLVQDEIDNAAALRDLINQAGARAAAKGLDLTQDTAAFKQGVMSEAEWRARVAGLGYDDADVEILFETLAASQAATAAKSAQKGGAG